MARVYFTLPMALNYQRNIQNILVERWKNILMGTDLKPIDDHTPMWLWSRGKFRFLKF